MSSFKLLTVGNPKTIKGQSKGYLTFILHLAPANISGHETCPKRSAGCTAACLNTAGRGGMFKKGETTNVIQQARIRKTQEFFANKEEFLFRLAGEIKRAINYAERKGLTPVFRLNGTSDISWEKYKFGPLDLNIFDSFPNVQFYDYTKVLGRKVQNISNYHLTFSATESNQAEFARAYAAGMNVAVVFDQLPEEYMSIPVINADESDLRFLDPAGVVCGLKAKGRAKKDSTGFVRKMIAIGSLL